MSSYRVAALMVVLGVACSSESAPVLIDRDITVATLNVLHGLFCPNPTQQCRQADRLDLLFDWIEGSGCPDVVALQEITGDMGDKVSVRIDGRCPFAYEMWHERFNGFDDAIVLSRYPFVDAAALPLYKGFRHALAVRVDHPLGAIDVLTTHLASGSDGANDPCDADCPSECTAASAATVRQCQAVQLAGLVAGRSGADLILVTGDFNAPPGSFEYDYLVTGSAWRDTYLAAGGSECDSGTGVGCTSGREDELLDELEDPALNWAERIDYIFDASAAPSLACDVVLEPGGDADGDSVDTGAWAHEPNPFATDCGPAPSSICWPSDHGGVIVDFNCSGSS